MYFNEFVRFVTSKIYVQSIIIEFSQFKNNFLEHLKISDHCYTKSYKLITLFLDFEIRMFVSIFENMPNACRNPR